MNFCFELYIWDNISPKFRYVSSGKGSRLLRLFDTNCIECGEYINKQYNKTESKKFYFCSIKCQLQSQRTGILKDKKEKTSLERYGVKNPSMIPAIRDKANATNLEKFGVINVSSSPEIKKKKKETMMKNYGVDSPLKSKEIYEKVKATNLIKYGYEIPMGTKEFIENTKKVSLEKYGVEHYSQTEEYRNFFSKNNPLHDPAIIAKVKATCLKLYGVDNIFKTDKAKDGFKKWLNDNKDNLASKQEEQFCELVLQPWAEHNNFTILKQYYIKCWFIDFYIPELNLLILFDGVFWHGLDKSFEELKELIEIKGKNSVHNARYNNKHKDAKQNKYFEKLGYKILRITDEDYVKFIKQKPCFEEKIKYMNNEIFNIGFDIKTFK